ncbi:MAG TPA: CarD family transcriptional regulator, partial [Gaiellaceae bacterium]|nr:CarD family transcriptional regulator [Gaiellaceae bacterium]
MDLKVGTVVAYPPHGVGRVIAREKRVILGQEEEVVVLQLGNELSVTLPISRAEEQLRPPATEADLKKVQKALREQGVVS